MIIPKDTTANFDTEKGKTLSEFAYYFLCEGQQQAEALGYAPLPINLVQAGIDQAGQIPGSTHKLDRNDLSNCHNPTVSPDGGNAIAKNAPQPDPCDLKGAPTQCATGTGGAPGTGGGTGQPTPPPTPPEPGPGPGPGGGDSLGTIITEVTAGLKSFIQFLQLLLSDLGVPQLPFGPQ